jgi:hypothetical protein
MPARFTVAPRDETDHFIVSAHENAVVVIGRRVRNNGHGHIRTARDVRVEHGPQVEITQRVAVDDQEWIGLEEWQRAAGSPRRSQHRLLPRITHAETEMSAIT